MTTLKRAGFEGQTSGVTPSAANSSTFGDDAMSGTDFSVGASNTMAYSSAQAMHGGRSVLMTSGGANASLFGYKVNPTGLDSGIVRFYVYLLAYPALTIQFGCQFRHSAGALARNNLTSTGQLQWLIGAGTATSGAVVMALNTWYRIEAQISASNTAGSSAGTCDLYTGDSPTSLSTMSLSAVTAGGLLDNVRFGYFAAASTLSMHIDDVALDSGTTIYTGPGSMPPYVPVPDRTGVRATRVSPRRRRPAEVFLGVVVPTAPVYVPQLKRTVRQGTARRPRRGAVPIPVDQLLPGPARPERRALYRRRPGVPTVVPAQVVVTAPPLYPLATDRVVRRALARRRAGIPAPVPGQLAPFGTPRPERRALYRRRPGAPTVVPAQVAAAAPPPYPLAMDRVVRRGLARRRPAAPTVVPDQVVAAAPLLYPLSMARVVRRALSRRRPMAPTVVPDQVLAAAAPPYPLAMARVVRRGLVRRRPMAPTVVPAQVLAATAPPYVAQLRTQRRLQLLTHRGRTAVAPVAAQLVFAPAPRRRRAAPPRRRRPPVPAGAQVMPPLPIRRNPVVTARRIAAKARRRSQLALTGVTGTVVTTGGQVRSGSGTTAIIHQGVTLGGISSGTRRVAGVRRGATSGGITSGTSSTGSVRQGTVIP